MATIELPNKWRSARTLKITAAKRMNVFENFRTKGLTNFCCFASGVSVNVYPQRLTHNWQTTAPWEKFTINLNWN